MGKIKGKNSILEAMRHNKRTLPSASCIDKSRSHLNYSLTNNDTPEKIASYAKALMLHNLNHTLRKDAVMAVEIIFSLPTSMINQDTRPFFKDCYEWVKTNITGQMLAFDVHLDEAAPHAHAVSLPLVDGKMIGSKVLGGTGNLIRLRKKFVDDVGMNYGLLFSEEVRLSEKLRYDWASMVISNLANNPLAKEAIWPIIQECITKNPAPFAKLLSIEPPTKPLRKSFVDYKRARGKGSFQK